MLWLLLTKRRPWHDRGRVEIRALFRRTEPTQTQHNALLVQPLGQVENVDTYYDTAGFDCLQQAVFIRIRNQKDLEIKYHEHADPAHMHATERVFSLESGPLLVKEMNVQCARFIPEWQEAGTIEE